jgi:hypothetical protein
MTNLRVRGTGEPMARFASHAHVVGLFPKSCQVDRWPTSSPFCCAGREFVHGL